jgi:hypothetical protein
MQMEVQGQFLNSDYTTQWYFIASISYPSNISCAGSAAGSATVTASGGIGTLTYSWNNPIQTTATANRFDCRKLYSTITDANTSVRSKTGNN